MLAVTGLTTGAKPLRRALVGELLLLMLWTAPTRRHLGAKVRGLLQSADSLLMARTYRQSHLLNMSGVGPIPDLPPEMSGSPPTPDVGGTRRLRGVLTHNGPTGDEIYGHQGYRNSVISAPAAVTRLSWVRDHSVNKPFYDPKYLMVDSLDRPCQHLEIHWGK